MKTVMHVYHTPQGALRICAFTKGRAARTGGKAVWNGPSKLVTGKQETVSGATAWIETHAPVKVSR